MIKIPDDMRVLCLYNRIFDQSGLKRDLHIGDWSG
jgi:hypothetical protein